MSLLFLAGAPGADTPKPGNPPAGPLSPREELATFRVPKGFKVELVASEPDVIDPVAMAFDERGRLFVAEMRGYPNGGVATGVQTLGRIRCLTDEDGDGVFEKSTVYAEGLRFPSGVMPWKGGLLACVAPDLIYLEETKGGGRAEKRRTLYTGFDLANIQQLVNSPQWGLDNWVYGCAGGKGGDIRSAEKPDRPAVVLRGRGIRFHPETPGSLEPTSGGGQYGLAADDFQHWFTATNSQHLRQIVLPDHYLRRNPLLAVPAVTLDIPDHGAACKVHRVSPFEAWRVERTMRRAGGPDAKRFPATELVPGGYITSACSPVVYTADRFPEAYRGSTFVCDPANNLIHRDVLKTRGSTFTASRGEEDCEFLASTDTWFRPVYLTVGPDGALYVLDFYREVIETPLSLPDDIKKKLNLESRGRGRIWRVKAENAPAGRKPKLHRETTAELVAHLADPNPWWRLTAQRLLVERQDKTAVPTLEKLARNAATPAGKVHALWTLDGLKALPDALVEVALHDRHPAVREQGLRLAEGRAADSAAIRTAVLTLTDDPSAEVRFQAALSLGALEPAAAGPALAKIVRRDGADRWVQTAVLSSARRSAPDLLEALVADRPFVRSEKAGPFLVCLAALIGAGADDAGLARALKLLESDGGEPAALAWQTAVLEGLGAGAQNTSRPLTKLWDKPPAALAGAAERVRPFFQRAAKTADDAKRPAADRLAAVRLLANGPFTIAGPALAELLAPQTPAAVQLAAVRALAAQPSPEVAGLLLNGWEGQGPAMRREILEALFARTDRLARLLDAVEKKQVLAAQLEPARLTQLRNHSDAALRKRALTLLAGQGTVDRKKVIDGCRPALELTGDAKQGKTLFKKHCATCHRLENEGYPVGPDLLAALRNKTPEALLIDIMDPNREVDPRYVNYTVTTENGRSFSGILAVEAPSSITLRRGEGAEDTILRNQIETIRATAQSLMPEGFEKQLGKQDLADLIAYLQKVAVPK